ncbi:MAG TPA: hypothetical protein VGP61_02045 [Gemmatimonadales bacterium]|nr:hypothetical protein [Gemmatimonadales bacterium]
MILLPILLGAVVLLLPILPPIELSRASFPPGADSAVVIAGERYRAGPVRQLLLGRHYRELWTVPLKVEVLKLAEFDGGLIASKEGGHRETRSLHFISAIGRHFVFRSVDKEVTRVIREDLRRTLLAWMLQDQTSASHPAGALVAAPLQAAVGLPLTHPRLVLLPDDARLGAFRVRFAGLLGTLQESPGENLATPPDSNAANHIKETDSLLALLDAGSNNRVDERGFLTARLLDLLLNDWDRHAGQWRWLPLRESWGTLWQPDPIDRDQAFSRYSGVLLDLVRIREPKFSKFGPDYPALRGLTWNSMALDHRLLSGLSLPAWDSIAGFLTARLTDSVISEAVRQMPEPYWRLSGARLLAALEQRRGQLRSVARQFYLQLARRPELYCAGAGEILLARYEADGSLQLTISRDDSSGAVAPWFARRFLPAETEQVALYFRRGRPRIAVTGTPSGGLTVQLIHPNGQAEALTPAR